MGRTRRIAQGWCTNLVACRRMIVRYGEESGGRAAFICAVKNAAYPHYCSGALAAMQHGGSSQSAEAQSKSVTREGQER